MLVALLFFWRNYANLLFEKIANKSKKYNFCWFWPSLRTLQVFGVAWIRHGRRHFVICSLA